MEDVGFGLEKRSWKSKEVAIRCVCVRVYVGVGVCVCVGVWVYGCSCVGSVCSSTQPHQAVLGTVPASQAGGWVGGEVGT